MSLPVPLALLPSSSMGANGELYSVMPTSSRSLVPTCSAQTAGEAWAPRSCCVGGWEGKVGQTPPAVWLNLGYTPLLVSVLSAISRADVTVEGTAAFTETFSFLSHRKDWKVKKHFSICGLFVFCFSVNNRSARHCCAAKLWCWLKRSCKGDVWRISEMMGFRIPADAPQCTALGIVWIP